MFKKFIVATDLSPASYAVVSCLAGLKAYGAEQCLLLQCFSFADGVSTALAYNVDRVKAMMDDQKLILEQQGFVVESQTVFGSPKREIVQIAVKEDYGLIVVGAQGQSLMEEKLLGGVAYGIINSSVKPVLVVPVEKDPGDDQACLPVGRCGFSEHILFATDFSQIADKAFAYVEQLVVRGVQKVTLVHVQDTIKIDRHVKELLKTFNEHDRGRLDILKKALLQKGSIPIETEVCHGTPYQEITRLIRERNVQLVVMGSQGKGFVGEFFLGSVSHNVLRYSVAPVLIIPALR